MSGPTYIAFDYVDICKSFLERGIEGEGVYVLKDAENTLYSHRHTMEWVLALIEKYVGEQPLPLPQSIEYESEGVTLRYFSTKYYISIDCTTTSSAERRLVPKLVKTILNTSHVLGIPHIIIIRHTEKLSLQCLVALRAVLLKQKSICFCTCHINPSNVMRVLGSLSIYIPIKVLGSKKLTIPPPKVFAAVLNGKLCVKEFVTKHIMSGDVPWRVLWNWVLSEAKSESVKLRLIEMTAIFDKNPKNQIILETFMHSAIQLLNCACR
jgi:hypothetical protein